MHKYTLNNVKTILKESRVRISRNRNIKGDFNRKVTYVYYDNDP